MPDGFTVLEPVDGLDGVALIVALERGRTTVVHNLLLGLNFHGERG